MTIITENNPLPVKIAGYGSFTEFLLREGDPVSWSSFSSSPVAVATGAQNASITTATGAGLQSVVTTVGKAVFLDELTVGLSAPALAQVEIAASSDGRFPNFLKQLIVSTTSVSIKVGRIIRGFLNANNSNIVLTVRNNLAAGSVDYYGAVSASGYRITDDFNFDASKRVLFIGDSILNGTSGPTKTALQWAFIVKSYLVSLGYDIRVILKSVSGSTTADHESWRAAGYHDIADPALIVYAVGVNDAGAAVSDAAYTANITAFWNWAKVRYPNAKMIVCGVTPLENNTSETRAAGLRAAASAFVAAQDDAHLKYVNLGAAFDRTVSSNYASTDTAGSRVHPNDTGHGLVAAAFNSAWPDLGLTL